MVNIKYKVHYTHQVTTKRKVIEFLFLQDALDWAFANRHMDTEIERVESSIIWTYKDGIAK